MCDLCIVKCQVILCPIVMEERLMRFDGDFADNAGAVLFAVMFVALVALA